MRRIAKAAAASLLSVAIAMLPACTPVQNPYTNNGVSTSPVGDSNSFGAPTRQATPSNAGTVAGGTIDSPQSEALSDYLKHHQLPLVGAQVVSGSSGKQVILFGFVASDYGKTDAEQKARKYLKDPTVVVDNRIKVSPELAGGKGGSGSSAGASSSGDPYASGDGSAGSLQDYENNMPPDAQAYQQQQQYQQYGGSSGSAGMLTTVIPLLGLLGGFGGGTSFGGGSYGGFSSGYAPGYGSYGYPTYPPPMPGSGWGSSYPYPYP